MEGDMKIVFRLRAEVNGQSFEMNGEGTGNRQSGSCVLHLEASPKFPDGFDPVSCPNICSHPTSSFFSRATVGGADFPTITDGAYRVEPARQGFIHDSSGSELLSLQVSGRVWTEGSCLISEHQMRGTSRLPRLARNVTPFDDHVIPSRIGEATAIVRFKLLSLTGEELDGMTIVPYRWDSGKELQYPLIRTVEAINVDWDGKNRVSAYYRTSVSPLLIQDAAQSLAMSFGAGAHARRALIDSVQ